MRGRWLAQAKIFVDNLDFTYSILECHPTFVVDTTLPSHTHMPPARLRGFPPPPSLCTPRMPRARKTVFISPAPPEAPKARPEGARPGIAFAVRDMVLGGNRTEWGKAWIPESGGSGPQSGLPPTKRYDLGQITYCPVPQFPRL